MSLKIFWASKLRNSNRRSPLNNSIEKKNARPLQKKSDHYSISYISNTTNRSKFESNLPKFDILDFFFF